MKALQSTLILLATASLLAPGAAAQSSVEVEADLAFALGLAERFLYVDLAEAVLEKVDARGVSGDQQAALDLARCKIYGGVARREGDEAKREELYQKSLDAYRGFLDRHPFATNLTDAQREYVDLVNAYGRVLESALEDQVGDEAEATRATLQAAVEKGLELTGELIDGVDSGANINEQKAKYRLMLSRGQMLLTLAKVSPEPVFMFTQAERTLEDLALESGETSVEGLQAYLLLGEVKVAQGQFEDARAFMEFVADVAVPVDPQALKDLGWSEYPAQVKQQRFKMLELGMSALINACVSGGNAPEGVKWGLHLNNIRNADGLTLSARGDLALLSLSRALLSSGGYVGGSVNQGDLRWFPSEEEMSAAGIRGSRNTRSAIDLALSLAQDVNDRNKGNTLQIRAQAVISEITERPGVRVSPAILFEAAQGKYYSKDFEGSIASFRHIRDLLDAQDDATQKEFGARTLHFLANSYNRLGLKLEAGLTFREAIKVWKGDPEYDAKNASGYLAMMRELKSSTSDAQPIVEMFRDAENVFIENQEEDADPGKILLSQGDRKYSSGDYDGAREKYTAVEKTSKYYEKCATKAALCLYKDKKFDAASAEFAEYVDDYVTNASNEVTDDVRQAIRKEALAMANFYLGRIAFSAGDFEETIKRLDKYATRFPAQDSYGPNALYMVLESRLRKNQVPEARVVLEQMIENFRTSQWTGRGAFKIYSLLKADYEKEPSQELLVQMAEFLAIYIDLSEPSFANSRQLSKLWMDAEEWAKAENVLRGMQKNFTTGEDAENVTKFALPDLGQVLLAQHQVPEAFAVLDPLVPDADSDDKISATTIRMWCEAVTGWLEGTDQDIIEVPGVGGAANLEKAVGYWNKLTGAEGNIREKWTCPWYELKLMSAYAYYQWGKLDSQQTATGKKLIDDLINVGFQGDREMKLVTEACGDDVLRRRFLWLLRKVS